MMFKFKPPNLFDKLEVQVCNHPGKQGWTGGGGGGWIIWQQSDF